MAEVWLNPAKEHQATVKRWVEQDYRFIKKTTRPMLGFKSFASTEATRLGIELQHIIRKGQLELQESTPFEQFYALAGKLRLKGRSAREMSGRLTICDRTTKQEPSSRNQHVFRHYR